MCKFGYRPCVYHVTVLSHFPQTCRDCSNKPVHYYFSLFLTLFFGLLLVAVVIYFNIAASPTVDSLLFFIQATYLLLVGRDDYDVFKFLAFFNPNFTFDLCITANLDGLTRLILQYVTPTYILLLMLGILLLSRIRRFSRLIGRRSILQGLWLLFLVSYLNIAIASFEILYCTRIGPIETNGTSNSRTLVLIGDASVQCYKGLHLPFAILAFVTLILFVVPLPMYTLVMARVAKLKPISDVYCSWYKDNWRWWIVVSLSRRLLLVVVGVFVQGYGSRHFSLLVCIGLILLVQVLSWPYRTHINNYFAFFATWMLLLVAIVTQPNVYFIEDPHRAVSLFLVILTISSGLALLVLEISLRILKKKTVGKFYKDSVRPCLGRYRRKLRDLTSRSHTYQHELEESTHSKTILPKSQVIDATSYREPLLDSQFYQPAEVESARPRNSVTSTSIRVSGNRPKSIFSRKKFDDSPIVEEQVKGVTATEVSAGHDSDEALNEGTYMKMNDS